MARRLIWVWICRNLINRANGTLPINYKFVTDSNIDLAVLTDGVFVSALIKPLLIQLVQLKFNKKNLQEDDLTSCFYSSSRIVLDFKYKPFKTLLT
jgi:hypothetical protein